MGEVREQGGGVRGESGVSGEPGLDARDLLRGDRAQLDQGDLTEAITLPYRSDQSTIVTPLHMVDFKVEAETHGRAKATQDK